MGADKEERQAYYFMRKCFGYLHFMNSRGFRSLYMVQEQDLV